MGIGHIYKECRKKWRYQSKSNVTTVTGTITEKIWISQIEKNWIRSRSNKHQGIFNFNHWAWFKTCWRNDINSKLFTTPSKSSTSGTEFHSDDKCIWYVQYGTVVFKHSKERTKIKTILKYKNFKNIMYVSKVLV